MTTSASEAIATAAATSAGLELPTTGQPIEKVTGPPVLATIWEVGVPGLEYIGRWRMKLEYVEGVRIPGSWGRGVG